MVQRLDMDHQANTSVLEQHTQQMTSNSSRPANEANNYKLLLQLQPFNGLFSRTTWVSRYQKVKTNLDFTGARDSEWQWHQLGHMQVCTSLQTDNHTSTPLSFLQAGCPSCHPTNSVKALKALIGKRKCGENYNKSHSKFISLKLRSAFR